MPNLQSMAAIARSEQHVPCENPAACDKTPEDALFTVLDNVSAEASTQSNRIIAHANECLIVLLV
jgi:hypothetical protein